MRKWPSFQKKKITIIGLSFYVVLICILWYFMHIWGQGWDDTGLSTVSIFLQMLLCPILLGFMILVFRFKGRNSIVAPIIITFFLSFVLLMIHYSTFRYSDDSGPNLDSSLIWSLIMPLVGLLLLAALIAGGSEGGYDTGNYSHSYSEQDDDSDECSISIGRDLSPGEQYIAYQDYHRRMGR